MQDETPDKRSWRLCAAEPLCDENACIMLPFRNSLSPVLEDDLDGHGGCSCLFVFHASRPAVSIFATRQDQYFQGIETLAPTAV